ncbi:MAG: DUF190 domain-containing protein [Solidesulfovibrio sp. DCME]|uniref:DUF190 domain-containing protein n=1 Tax=Solidesulfovibrio sp. DCME TaxID=3447380 RepID=UPI003D1037B1
MSSFVDARVLRLYLGRGLLREGRPLADWIVARALRHGLCGATVSHGAMGLGGQGRPRTARILRLAEALPVVVEIVDTPGRIEAFLPEVRAVARPGTVVVEEAGAVFRLPRRVRDVMTEAVASVAPATPVVEAVRLLLCRGVGGVPVVSEGRPVGLVTGRDVLARAGLGLDLDMLRALPPRPLGEFLRRLDAVGLSCAVAMTVPARVVRPEDSLALVVARLAGAGCKRLPVVDGGGELAGIVGRADVLRAVANPVVAAAQFPALASGAGLVASDVACAAPPVVAPEARLSAVLPLFSASPGRRLAVVDAAGRLAGLVTGRSLAEWCLATAGAGLLAALVAAMRGEPGAKRLAGAARDALCTGMPVIGPATPLAEMARLFVERGAEVLVVAGEDGRFAGLVDREAALSGLAAPMAAGT